MKDPRTTLTETLVIPAYGWKSAATRALAIGAVATLLIAGGGTRLHAQRIGGSAAAQPAAKVIAGISCDAQEGQRMHIHQHLVILDRGKEVAVPYNVGQPEDVPCIYWLHTHKTDGIIHVEAPLNRKFTLGDFFAIWGQPLSRTRAATAVAAKGGSLTVYVNGKKYVGDPSKIELVAHADIVIMTGPPFPKLPVFTAWGTL